MCEIHVCSVCLWDKINIPGGGQWERVFENSQPTLCHVTMFIQVSISWWMQLEFFVTRKAEFPSIIPAVHHQLGFRIKDFLCWRDEGLAGIWLRERLQAQQGDQPCWGKESTPLPTLCISQTHSFLAPLLRFKNWGYYLEVLSPSRSPSHCESFLSWPIIVSHVNKEQDFSESLLWVPWNTLENLVITQILNIHHFNFFLIFGLSVMLLQEIRR